MYSLNNFLNRLISLSFAPPIHCMQQDSHIHHLNCKHSQSSEPPLTPITFSSPHTQKPWAAPPGKTKTKSSHLKRSNRNPTSPSLPPPRHPKDQWTSSSTAATAPRTCRADLRSFVRLAVHIGSHRRIIRSPGFMIRNYRLGWVREEREFAWEIIERVQRSGMYIAVQAGRGCSVRKLLPLHSRQARWGREAGWGEEIGQRARSRSEYITKEARFCHYGAN